eukprot:5443096-Amphidinium_carterae.1
MRELYEKAFAVSRWETSSMSVDEASTTRARGIFTTRRCADAADVGQAILGRARSSCLHVFVQKGTIYLQDEQSGRSVMRASWIARAQLGAGNAGVATSTSVPLAWQQLALGCLRSDEWLLTSPHKYPGECQKERQMNRAMLSRLSTYDMCEREQTNSQAVSSYSHLHKMWENAYASLGEAFQERDYLERALRIDLSRGRGLGVEQL